MLAEEETAAYGRTIVLQVERLLAVRQRWTLAGLSADKAQIKHRVAMICGFEKRAYRRSSLTMALLACLACVGLTDALAAADWDVYARGDFRTTNQDRHGNIQRCCIRNIETGKYLAVDGERVVCDADEPGKAGLWEFRFEEATNTPKDVMYFYSVRAGRYLTSDKKGNSRPTRASPMKRPAGPPGPRPDGVFVISHNFKDGYLRLDKQGQVHAENFGRDSRGYWEIHSVWRVKTSDDPASNPQWQRESTFPGRIDMASRWSRR